MEYHHRSALARHPSAPKVELGRTRCQRGRRILRSYLGTPSDCPARPESAGPWRNNVPFSSAKNVGNNNARLNRTASLFTEISFAATIAAVVRTADEGITKSFPIGL